MIYFYFNLLFGAVPTAFVLKVIVIQCFGDAVGAVFENRAVLISRHARLLGVHAGPNTA